MKERPKKATGNTEGFEGGVNAIDPLHRKNFMCSASLDKLLKKLVYDSGNKISESGLIREALIKAYT